MNPATVPRLQQQVGIDSSLLVICHAGTCRRGHRLLTRCVLKRLVDTAHRGTFPTCRIRTNMFSIFILEKKCICYPSRTTFGKCYHYNSFYHLQVLYPCLKKYTQWVFISFHCDYYTVSTSKIYTIRLC